jgi:hypothetical protein
MIVTWSYLQLFASSRHLLDMNPDAALSERVRAVIEKDGGTKVSGGQSVLCGNTCRLLRVFLSSIVCCTYHVKIRAQISLYNIIHVLTMKLIFLQVTDLHIWRLGPGCQLGAILSLSTPFIDRDVYYYRHKLKGFKALSHLTIEIVHERR